MKFERFFVETEAVHLQDAYDTITRLGLWEWLRGYTPHAGDDFFFDVGPEIDAIRRGLASKDVAGTTFAWMMRRMRSIAVLGDEEWIRRITADRKPCPCRLAKGYQAGWCGVAGGGVPGCDH
jgi:hypothetical protein